MAAHVAERKSHPPRPLARVPVGEERFVIGQIDWHGYEKILDALGDHGSVRVTYDRGRLELMSPLRIHEVLKKTLARLVEMIAFELQFPISCCGHMTCRREDLDRGFEPDECYYLANESAVRGFRELDFTRDPPPDLIIEVDITRSSLDRQAIFAAFRVPELWRHDGQSLHFLHLQPDGVYQPRDHSLSFPSLPVVVVEQWLAQVDQLGEFEVLRLCREWVRANVPPARPVDGGDR